MADILKLFLVVSVMASIMIGIVLIIRSAFSKKMSPAVMLLLWGMVLLRLILPVTISSPVRLSGLFPQQTFSTGTNYGTVTAEDQMPGMNPAANNISDLTGTNKQPSTEAPLSPAEAVPAGSAGVTPADLLKNIPWWKVLAVIWIAGIAAVLFLFVWKAASFRRKLRFCNQVSDKKILNLIQVHKKETGVKKAVIALECDFVRTPAVFGYFKPCILIPSRFLKEMDQDSLNAIMLHEIFHIRCHDILTNYIWLAAKALHWFNPFVWFAYKCFEDDVELRRDQKAAQVLEEDGMFVYSESLIEAARFSRQTGNIPSSAAALFEKKYKLRQRISRLIKPQRKTKYAAVVSAMLAIVMIFACFTTACQPTPEEPVVIGKGDSHLEEMIASSAVSPYPEASLPPEATEDPSEIMAALRESLGAPEAYKESYTNKKGDINVYIDASVEVPAVTDIPAIEVKFAGFTQDDVNRYAAYFLKGAPVYTEDRTVHTKDEIQSMILSAQSQLARSRATGDAEDSPVVADYERQTERRIEELQAQYQTAPEEREKTPATLELKKTEYGTKVSVCADLGKDGGAEFSVNNSESGSGLSFDNQGRGMYMLPFHTENGQSGAPRGMTATLEEAKNTAEKCVYDLGIEDMIIESVEVSSYMEDIHAGSFNPTDPNVKQCYLFNFERLVGGIPMPHISGATSNDGDDPNMPEPEDPEYEYVPNPERLMIFVDDTGIVQLQWDCPTTEEEILSGHVTLKPFPDIVEKAKDYMFYKTYTASNCRCDIHITSIRLSMMRIMQKDRPGNYMLVPVWDFIGNREQFVDGFEPDWLPFGDQSYVTINAIDGSNINRDWGY